VIVNADTGGEAGAIAAPAKQGVARGEVGLGLCIESAREARPFAVTAEIEREIGRQVVPCAAEKRRSVASASAQR
jgi:hypothetical protein